MPVHEGRLRLMLEDRLEQRGRFGLGHALDADRVAGAHEQRGAPGLGMTTPDRVQLGGPGAVVGADRHRATGILVAIQTRPRIAAARRVHPLATLDRRAQRRRQFIPGQVLVGEQRVAAHRRNGVPIEQRAGRRTGQEAPVGVPAFGEQRRRFIGFATHLDHLRVIGERRDEGILAEGSDAGRVSLQITDRQRLIREGDDLVREPRLADRPVLRLGQGARQVDAAQQRAAALSAGFDGKSHVGARRAQRAAGLSRRCSYSGSSSRFIETRKRLTQT